MKRGTNYNIAKVKTGFGINSPEWDERTWRSRLGREYSLTDERGRSESKSAANVLRRVPEGVLERTPAPARRSKANIDMWAVKVRAGGW